MVAGTAEQQFRARARRALEADKSFSARGPVNKAILEEVRAEVAAGTEHVRASASSGVKRIKSHTARGVQQITEVKDAALREIASAKRQRLEPVVPDSPAAPVLEPASEVDLSIAPRSEVLSAGEEDGPQGTVALIPEAVPSAEVSISDAANRARLRELVAQLEMLKGCHDPFSSFVREKLDLEKQILLGEWSQGRWLLYDMNRHARRQREDFLSTSAPSSEQPPVLQLTQPQQQTLELYRTEFENEKADTHQSIVQLQLAALEVEAQRKAACAEREGLSFHDGYQKAVKAFNRAFDEACTRQVQTFADGKLIAQCCMKAGLRG